MQVLKLSVGLTDDHVTLVLISLIFAIILQPVTGDLGRIGRKPMLVGFGVLVRSSRIAADHAAADAQP
jgi:hypothetical protein